MKCRYCGSPIDPDAKKCPNCLWEGDDIAIEDIKNSDNSEDQEDLFESVDQPNTNEQASELPNDEIVDENIVHGLTKRAFFDYYIPDKIRSNTLWAVYLLFFSALANCLSALYDFYFGVICAAVCLALANSIKKTLNIGPAIGACVFTILITVINFVMTQTITGWISIIAAIFCCTSLNKFNSMWTIYTVTNKVPMLDPLDKARADARKERTPKKIGWIVYYAALALCFVGVVTHYALALSYIAKFDFGTTDANHYVNEFYGIDMTLRADWDVYDSKELASENEYTYGTSEPTAVDTQLLMYAATEKGEFVLIESYFIESLLYNSESMADEFEVLYGSGARTCERLSDVEYNGNLYEVLYIEYETTDEESGAKITYYDKLFTRTEGSYCVSVYVSTTEGADRLEDVCAMLMSSNAK